MPIEVLRVKIKSIRPEVEVAEAPRYNYGGTSGCYGSSQNQTPALLLPGPTNPFVLLHHHVRKARLAVFKACCLMGLFPGVTVVHRNSLTPATTPTIKVDPSDLGTVEWNFMSLNTEGAWRPLKITWSTGGYSFMSLTEVSRITPDMVV